MPPSKRFFYVRHIMATLYGRAVWEAERLAGSFARSANPHGSAHPLSSGEAENLNRLQRSSTMAKSSKSATALSSKPVCKLASVVSIQKFSPPLNHSARACISELEYLLSIARRGQLSGIAYVTLMRNSDEAAYDCTAEVIGDSLDHPLLTLGALALLKHDLLSQAEEIA